MKIYKNFSITDEKAFELGTNQYQMRITSAQMIPYAYEGDDVLGLKMKENITGKEFSYGLVYKKVQEEFKEDMKVGKIEELVGKKVLGFLNKNKSFLQGISLNKELRRNPNTK